MKRAKKDTKREEISEIHRKKRVRETKGKETHSERERGIERKMESRKERES